MSKVLAKIIREDLVIPKNNEMVRILQMDSLFTFEQSG
jgi:hypothetical protein